MALQEWRCDFPRCTSVTFNRKDLFGSHLKRMHGPGRSGGHKLDRGFLNELPKIQERCQDIKRSPPKECNCEICGTIFSGEKAWDLKMEHVGKHYEAGETLPHGKLDAGLVKWAIEQEFVVPNPDAEVVDKEGKLGSPYMFAGYKAWPMSAYRNQRDQ